MYVLYTSESHCTCMASEDGMLVSGQAMILCNKTLPINTSVHPKFNGII